MTRSRRILTWMVLALVGAGAGLSVAASCAASPQRPCCCGETSSAPNDCPMTPCQMSAGPSAALAAEAPKLRVEALTLGHPPRPISVFSAGTPAPRATVSRSSARPPDHLHDAHLRL